MANRTMQAKRLKLQRQLRRLPRVIEDPPGDFTEHSKTPIPARLKAEGVRAPMMPIRPVMQMYRNSAKSLETSMAEANEKCLEKFGFLHIGTPPGKKESFDRMIKFQMDRVQSLVNSRIGFNILDNSVHWARVYRNATSTAFVVLYVNFKEGVIRTSMSYRFQKNIVDDFRSNKLTWVETRYLKHG